MGYPWIAQRVVSHGRRALGKGGARSNSLIVVVNYGYMWGRGGLTCVILLGCYLGRFKLIRISAKPSDMGDTCLLQSFHRNAIPAMFI
jgi:hypothetical protein